MLARAGTGWTVELQDPVLDFGAMISVGLEASSPLRA